MIPLYTGIGGVRKEITELSCGVGGVKRNMPEMWAGIGGVNRQIFSSGIVGKIIALPEASASAEYIIVQEGNPPGGDYAVDLSDCVFVVRKVIATQFAFNPSGGPGYYYYSGSMLYQEMYRSIPSMLSEELYNNAIEISLPEIPNPIERIVRIFPLSSVELGLSASADPSGGPLDYFSSNESRIAYNPFGNADAYWTRSISIGRYGAIAVTPIGTESNSEPSTSLGVRWAMVLKKSYLESKGLI